jgi:hypothetical protein
MKSCTQRVVELATPRRKTTPTKVKRVTTLKAQSRPFPRAATAKRVSIGKDLRLRQSSTPTGAVEGQPQLRRDVVPVVTTGANAAVGVAALLDEGRQPQTRLGEGGVNASQGAAAGRAPPYTLPTLQDIQAEQRIDQEVAMYVNTYSALLWGARAP